MQIFGFNNIQKLNMLVVDFSIFNYKKTVIFIISNFLIKL